MSDKPKRKKRKWQQIIPIVLFMIIGGVCGVLMVPYIDAGMSSEGSIGEIILSLSGLFVMMYVAFFLQIIIHEGGHLVFGHLTGYKFSSFRIMSFMWVKDDDKIRFKRLSLAGTGGQCLMNPPDLVDGRIPVVLYNLGGSLMNVIASLICLILWLLLKNVPFLSTVLLMLVVIGIAFALMNGIPMRLGTVDNDGYNALSISKNPDGVYSFWMQMKVNGETARGIRLKDMPEEWFTVPADEEMKNSIVAVRGVFVCNRLMDAHQFEEVDQLMEHLLAIESGIVGLHRDLMTCDRIYCELIGENRQEILDGMLTKDLKKFMKSMKSFPSVLRTEYVYALLVEKDTEKAGKIKEQFEKCAKTYPYPNDILSERELMDLAAGKILI